MFRKKLSIAEVEKLLNEKVKVVGGISSFLGGVFVCKFMFADNTHFVISCEQNQFSYYLDTPTENKSNDNNPTTGIREG